MDFIDFMNNLCIGIISGAFSSIIVSRIFLIISNCSEQLLRVQPHFENIEKLLCFIKNALFIFIKYNISGDKKLLETIDDPLLAEIVDKAKQEMYELDSIVIDDLDEELSNLVTELRKYMIHLSYTTKVDEHGLAEIVTTLQDFTTRFSKYKSKKNEHLKKRILNDSWLRGLVIIFVFVIIATLILNVAPCIYGLVMDSSSKTL